MAHVKIYTASYCPYCLAAKNLLKDKSTHFEEINVEGNEALRAWLVNVSGQTTVPQIFINDQSIGGFQELKALNDLGQLDSKLQS